MDILSVYLQLIGVKRISFFEQVRFDTIAQYPPASLQDIYNLSPQDMVHVNKACGQLKNFFGPTKIPMSEPIKNWFRTLANYENRELLVKNYDTLVDVVVGSHSICLANAWNTCKLYPETRKIVLIDEIKEQFCQYGDIFQTALFISGLREEEWPEKISTLISEGHKLLVEFVQQNTFTQPPPSPYPGTTNRSQTSSTGTTSSAGTTSPQVPIQLVKKAQKFYLTHKSTFLSLSTGIKNALRELNGFQPNLTCLVKIINSCDSGNYTNADAWVIHFMNAFLNDMTLSQYEFDTIWDRILSSTCKQQAWKSF